MKKSECRQLYDTNVVINRLRDVYMDWAKKNQVNYHELIVLCLIHEVEACTQKQISEVYGLPKQTVNRITGALVKAGRLVVSPHRNSKKEKMVKLTGTGAEYTTGLRNSLRQLENAAIIRMGKEQYQMFIEMAILYEQSLKLEILASEYRE